MAQAGGTNLVVLYGIGGLSDVGRHAVLAGLEQPATNDGDGASTSNSLFDSITVITKHPDLLLKETHWNCGCGEHTLSEEQLQKINVVTIEQPWTDVDLSPYLTDSTTIVSCLGNRQPFFGHYDSFDGNNALLRAIDKIRSENETNATSAGGAPPKTFRVVVMTSVGINEDSPALEFFTIGRIAMALIYMVFARTMYHDLRTMENSYRSTGEDAVDFLLVRPVGLSEDVVPIRSWVVQREKFKHPLGFEMAKMDVARYMVEEAIRPTRHRTSVVVGADVSIRPVRITTPPPQSTK